MFGVEGFIALGRLGSGLEVRRCDALAVVPLSCRSPASRPTAAAGGSVLLACCLLPELSPLVKT